MWLIKPPGRLVLAHAQALHEHSKWGRPLPIKLLEVFELSKFRHFELPEQQVNDYLLVMSAPARGF